MGHMHSFTEGYRTTFRKIHLERGHRTTFRKKKYSENFKNVSTDTSQAKPLMGL